jgi:predicted ATPase
MVEELLRGQRLPAGTLTQIVAQTDGVPLFVEEVTKAVLEAECAPDVAASDTVPLADAALQRDLVTLVAAELLYQRGRPPRATYMFKHALIQEVAYESLLKHMRRGAHQHIVRILEAQFPETAATTPELLGDHALRLLGNIAARRDPLEAAQAEAHYQQALALAEALGMRPLVAHCHHGLGRLYG